MRAIEEQIKYARLRHVKLKSNNILRSPELATATDIFISYHSYMKLVKFSVTILNFRVTNRATHCHAVSITPTASDQPPYTAKLHLQQNCILKNCIFNYTSNFKLHFI